MFCMFLSFSLSVFYSFTLSALSYCTCNCVVYLIKITFSLSLPLILVPDFPILVVFILFSQKQMFHVTSARFLLILYILHPCLFYVSCYLYQLYTYDLFLGLQY
uniref:NADH dehydrogenase subunit 2 n=1 Tax=Cacopsylla melanoneura TaxID=428564 RepID=A0A8D8ZVW2_9HEMI